MSGKKFFDDKIAGYYLYCTSFDVDEPTHSHASDDPRMLEAGSAKIWVYKNGDTKIQHKGKADDDSLNKICKYIKNNYMVIFKKWEEKFGRLEVYGEPYVLYTVKGDELKFL